MTKRYQDYTASLETRLNEVYAVARQARRKGLDPALLPEIDVAKDLAALVEGLVGPKGVAESIRELSKKMLREELAFKVAEEIVYGKYGHLPDQEAAEQAVRTALAILTEGVTAAPLQGVAKVAIKDNPDRTRHLAIYFAGPIRSAGGTEQVLTLVVGDFVRRLLGLERYKPTAEEVGRFVEELRLYERTVGRFQYKVSDEELRNALESLPVEVTGLESNHVEVSMFRNLPRIETNAVRGGALRVVNDGVVGRALKAWTVIERLGIEGWDWLNRVVKIKKKSVGGFMEDIIAGRPIFSFPSRHGGFRLRYGRSRNTGLAAVGIHPTTMMALQSFLAAGTQLRVEGPGKACIVVPVDTIESPIVRLKDGSVVRLSSENFENMKNEIDKILFLGDILISFGDFLYNNKALPPSGMTEELWCQELQTAIQWVHGGFLEAAAKTQVPASRLQEIAEDPFGRKPNVREALALTSCLKIPLHPRFTYFWHCLSRKELQRLRRWLLDSKVLVEENLPRKITGDMDKTVKHLLEKICLPHKIVNDRIEIENEEASVFGSCLGWNLPQAKLTHSKNVSEAIEKLSGLNVRDKAPTFIGARMGRPEKAKRREMRPLVHVLFPVGLAGGPQRNIIKAGKKGKVSVDLAKRRCPICKEVTFTARCPKCNTEAQVEKFCQRCRRTVKEDVCLACGGPARSFEKQTVDLRGLLAEAAGKLNLTLPQLIKGVRGLSNRTKTAEILEKGILRAKYDLSVFKDGTIRFDATNAPLTHFKPAEIGTSIEKLRQFGYTHDASGEPLKNPQQICELRAQDVIVPFKCAEYFVRVADFLDELLQKVYGLPPYYCMESMDDLMGHLVVGLAPHILVGVLGRIVGFTNLNVCYAHPLWHSAKRRDCDGDEDTLMLALDTVLNFSKYYLPAQIGGMMDAPYFVISVVNPSEVQRQAHEVDVAASYPPVFYDKTWERASPQMLRDLIDMIEHRLGSEAQFDGYGYTIPVSDINQGNKDSIYKKLQRMTRKLRSQMLLAEKIEAVDAQSVASRVLTTHFMRDISGNLRAFSTQSFRCKGCNKKFRRMPLLGKCPECGGLLTLTVYRGGIEKYVEAADQLVRRYNLPMYYSQRLALVQDAMNSLFEGKKPRQVSLKDFIP